MKKIGIVGGISWTSTIEYYRLLNQNANAILGGLHYPECIIYSVNFEKFCRANAMHDWDATFHLLRDAVTALQQAGAEVILLAANTAHIVADRITDEQKVRLVDIRTATIDAIKKNNFSTVGLLGTKYTMELDFYKERLRQHQLTPLIPKRLEVRNFIEETLALELGKGIFRTTTRTRYQQIIQELIQDGAQGIILGCTEIPLLIQQQHVPVPVFNTIELQVDAAIATALE